MTIKQEIRSICKSNQKLEYCFMQTRRIREAYALSKFSDYDYITSEYESRFGEPIDLKNPETLGAKLQWLKLFYRDNRMPMCTDKYAVREYLYDLGLGHLCNDLIGVYKKAKDIDFDSLPSRFVVKANHGSGWNLICEDKSQLNWKDETRLLDTWLKLNCYTFGREWNYKEIPPRLVVERYIEATPLNDYKFMCYNGVPRFVQLNNDFEGNHYVDFYDIDTWEHLPVTYDHFARSNRNLPKPSRFDEMLQIARTLSEPFPFVRVDLYNANGRIIFGELTFFPSSGLWPIVPREFGYDVVFGQPLQLPEPNHNIELFEKISKEKKCANRLK